MSLDPPTDVSPTSVPTSDADVHPDVAASETDLHALVAALTNRLDAQERELAELRARTSEVPVLDPSPDRGRVSGATGGSGGSGGSGAAITTDRRGLLRTAGLAAAGLVGAAALDLAGASPAAADDGQPIEIGADNDMTNSTFLGKDDAVQALPPIFVATNGPLSSFAYAGALVGNVWIEDGSTTVPPTPYGVVGVSNAYGGAGGFVSNIGTTASSGSVGLQVAAVDSHIYLEPVDIPDPRTSNWDRQAGELVFDGSSLWICIGSGKPGTWSRLAGPSTGSFTTLAAPARVYDSRPDNLPDNVTKAPLTNGESRGVSALVGQHVPLGATAIVANLTVVNTSEKGYVAAYTGGIPYPGTSSINWFQAGSVVANMAVIGLDATGFLTLTVSADSSTDIVVDVVGYYGG